jgi:hypothetical protein
LADNRIAEDADWDDDLLSIELKELVELDTSFEITDTGFEIAEIDLRVTDVGKSRKPDPDDAAGEPSGTAATRHGDLWALGPHRLLCGDARDGASFTTLLADQQAQMIFTDPPYNVRIAGHVSGLGAIKHREFVMASGEMSEVEFTEFLKTVFTNLAAASVEGAIHFVCMDWRHLREVLAAGHSAYSELKNVCCWVKDNGGMSAFYRSRHELVLVFKHGTGSHINNFGLGSSGRYRTNVWEYAGVNSFKRGRSEELAMHPTVKPVALVADLLEVLRAHRRKDRRKLLGHRFLGFLKERPISENVRLAGDAETVAKKQVLLAVNLGLLQGLVKGQELEGHAAPPASAG